MGKGAVLSRETKKSIQDALISQYAEWVKHGSFVEEPYDTLEAYRKRVLRMSNTALIKEMVSSIA